MGCFHPLKASKSYYPKKNGKHSIRFGEVSGDYVPLQLPCGQCIGCKLERSRQWAVRCYHEASLYNQNCFITLTYNDEYLPHDESINVRHFQLFMKRLRKKFPDKIIRYFHCGEYGEKLGRPHYHACIFNFDFEDKTLWKIQNDQRLYISETLSTLWGKGFCSIGNVTFESAAYVARYIMKKITGEKSLDHYTNFDRYTGEIIAAKSPEYVTMSRRPGIASEWFKKYKTDVYPSDQVIINGLPVRPPRFYDAQFELIEPENFIKIKQERVIKALKNESDNTPKRLLVKETICKNKLKKLPRKLHT